MKNTRIFIVSLLLVLCNPTSVLTNNIDDIVLQQWQNTYLTKMSPQELQFIANFLYLSYAITVVEEKIQQFTIPLSRLHQSIRTKIATYKDPTDDLAMLKTLSDRLSYVVGTRTIYLEITKTCNEYYDTILTNSSNAKIINDTLAYTQLDGQKKLLAWTNNHYNETTHQLKKVSAAMSSTSQYLQSASGLYRGMSEGELPIALSPEQELNKSLIILDAILQNNNGLLLLIEQVGNSLNEAHDHASHIINAGTDIYKQYYTIIYDTIMSPQCDKSYATTIFGMHGILPHEYRSLLPDPDHIFEHMLQTAKLYTQTELLQQ
jgi:hypothetical protein